MHWLKDSISKCNYFQSINRCWAVMKCQVTNPWQLLRALSPPNHISSTSGSAGLRAEHLWWGSCSQSSIKKQEWSCKDPELLSLTQRTIGRTRAKSEIIPLPTSVQMYLNVLFTKSKGEYNTKSISTQTELREAEFGSISKLKMHVYVLACTLHTFIVKAKNHRKSMKETRCCLKKQSPEMQMWKQRSILEVSEPGNTFSHTDDFPKSSF